MTIEGMRRDVDVSMSLATISGYARGCREMKTFHLILAMAWPACAWAHAEDRYVDAEAASKAKVLVGEARALYIKVDEACRNPSATGLLYEVAEDVVRKLDGWPDHYQKKQALTSYHACRQSLVNVKSYAYACAQGGGNDRAMKYMQRRWAEDSSACDEAIRVSELAR